MYRVGKALKIYSNYILQAQKIEKIDKGMSKKPWQPLKCAPPLSLHLLCTRLILMALSTNLVLILQYFVMFQPCGILCGRDNSNLSIQLVNPK